MIADFSGGAITSDGGLVLIAAIDKRIRLSERVAAYFSDQRQAYRVQHEVENLIIRLKLLKVAAQIRIAVRRVVIAFSSNWNGQSHFHHAYQRLQQLPRLG